MNEGRQSWRGKGREGRNYGVAFNVQYLGRNSTQTGRSFFGWDGKGSKGSSSNLSDVPNGAYTVRLTVTKALGFDDETEIWTSPAIALARA